MDKRIKFELMTLAVLVGVFFASKGSANTQPIPNYASNVQRMEHLGLLVDTSRCYRADWTAGNDGGTNFLLGQPDASSVPDAATDASLTGPAPKPESNVNYVCRADTNDACLKSPAAALPASCQWTFKVYAGQTTPPIMFNPPDDGGRAAVLGTCASGNCSIECCAVIPKVTMGR